MRNFRLERRDGGDSRGRFRNSGGRSRDKGRFRDRGESFGRRKLEMYEITCDKCGKQCEVPFKPTGDKPVYCRDCFNKEDSGSARFSSRNKTSGQAGMSSEQFNTLNKKLDKILGILESIEFEEDSDEDDDEDSEEEK